MINRKTLFAFILSCSLVAVPSCQQKGDDSSYPLLTTHIITIDGVEREIIDGQKAPLITPNDNDEQVFVCWMVDGQVFDPNTPITSSVSIVSHWRDRCIYHVYFDELETDVKEGFKAEQPVNPIKDGYEFVGWFEDAKKFDFNTPIYRDYYLVSRFSDNADETDLDYSILDYVDLGSVGGTNARQYQLGVHRDEKNLILKYKTAETEMFANYGVGFFIQIGEVESSTRNANSFLFSTFESGVIKLYNYPLNSKKTISTDRYNNVYGFKVQIKTDDSGIAVYARAPMSFFENFVDNDAFDKYSPIGLSFTSDNSSNGKYDVYNNSTYLGFNNKQEVDRSDPRDYLRLSHFGALFDAKTNKYDTFINVHSNAKSSTISYLNKVESTDSFGDHSINFKRNDMQSIDIAFDENFFAEAIKEIALTNDVNYEITYNLETKKENVSFKLLSLDGVSVIQGATITCQGGDYQSDQEGLVVIPNLDVAESIALHIEKDGYVTINKSYSLVFDIFKQINEIRLPALTDSVTLSGRIYDQLGRNIENAKISIDGHESIYSDNNGHYSIETTFQEKDLLIEANGYLGCSYHINPIDNQDTNYVFDFEATLDYITVGNIGGTKGYQFSIEATRNSNELLFRFITSSSIDKDLYPTSGITTFLTLGNIRKTSGRDERTFVITCYGTENDYFAHCPDGIKTNLNEENIATRRTIDGNKYCLTIPLSAFNKAGLKFKPLDNIGISFTSDKGSGYDTFSHEILGFNNSTHVDRTNALDYLTWTKNNEIKEYTNYIMNAQTLNDLFRSHPNYVSGKDFSSNRAEIETSNGTIETIADDAHMFTDRLTQKYDWDIDKAPIILFDGSFKYTYCAISTGSAFTVTKAGYVMLLVPNSSSYASLKNTVKATWGEFVLYSWNKCNSLSDNLDYAIKWCEVGESYNYGKFTIAIT